MLEYGIQDTKTRMMYLLHNTLTVLSYQSEYSVPVQVKICTLDNWEYVPETSENMYLRQVRICTWNKWEYVPEISENTWDQWEYAPETSGLDDLVEENLPSCFGQNGKL